MKSRGSGSLQARTATADRVVKSVCPYCAVGCAQNVYVHDERVVQIEGDPDSPVSRGRLCPKGAASLQLTTGSGRMHTVRYRPPHAADWQDLDLDTAMDMIADRIIDTRRAAWEWESDGARTARTMGIASLGGIINHVLSTGSYFHDYVVHYTDAATIVSDRFQDTEELDGLFSGFRPDTRHYTAATWQYQGMQVQDASGERDEEYNRRTRHGHSVRTAGRGEAHGAGGAATTGTPTRDETLRHPRCVLQILKRHYARYTPEMVERICGVPQETFAEVCRRLVENSGPERTAEFVYAVGWTQHTEGSQFIRAASVLQLLLGNMGRPGGGIQALRGHASIQGSSDIPTLFNLLPGYIPMPHAHTNETLEAFVAARKGYWAEMRSYLVSLLKAWWGPAASADNDFCFDHLPRRWARPTPGCSGWPWPTSTGWWCGPTRSTPSSATPRARSTRTSTTGTSPAATPRVPRCTRTSSRRTGSPSSSRRAG